VALRPGSGWIFAYNLQRMTVVDRMSNLRAENRSDNTVESYLESIRQADWLPLRVSDGRPS
jgi:hypothetical protein